MNTTLKRVEQCALKIHILLDLLVSENSLNKIFKYESSWCGDAADTGDLSANTAEATASTATTANNLSGSRYYRSKEFSNISNQYHRNSNDSWPSPSFSVDIKEEKLRSALSSQFSQYHGNHHQQQQSQAFNCYASSNRASESRGGYYDSSSNQNYNVSAHYGSSYASNTSSGVKSYRKLLFSLQCCRFICSKLFDFIVGYKSYSNNIYFNTCLE